MSYDHLRTDVSYQEFQEVGQEMRNMLVDEGVMDGHCLLFSNKSQCGIRRTSDF